MKYTDINIGDTIEIDWEDGKDRHTVVDAKDTFDPTGVNYTALLIDNMPDGNTWITPNVPIAFNVTQNKVPQNK